MSISQTQISQAIIYISRFASLASAGLLNRSSLENLLPKNDSRRRSSVESVKEAIRAALSGSKPETTTLSPARPQIVTDFFQNLLLGTSEKLSVQVRLLVNTLEAPPSFPSAYQKEYLQSSIAEIIPLVHSFAWLVTRAAAELSVYGSHSKRAQEQLLDAAQHIICSVLDLVTFSESVCHKAKKKEFQGDEHQKLKCLASYSIQTFISFLEKIQFIDRLVAKFGDRAQARILDLSLNAQAEVSAVLTGISEPLKQGGRRSSKNSISDIIYPCVTSPLPSSSPMMVQAKWNTKRDPDIVNVELEESTFYEPSAPVLPVEIARGLLTRKISLPPPYDVLADQIGFLKGINPQSQYKIEDIKVHNEDEAEKEGYENDVYIPSMDSTSYLSITLDIDIKRTMARVSFQKTNFLRKDWSEWKKCVVEVYGDLLSIHSITASKNKGPMFYGHLRHSHVVNVNKDRRTIDLAMGEKRIRLEFVNEKMDEWKNYIDKATRISS